MKLTPLVLAALAIFLTFGAIAEDARIYQGRDSLYWLGKLKSNDPSDRQTAAGALKQIGAQMREQFKFQSGEAARVAFAANRAQAVSRLSGITRPIGATLAALEAAKTDTDSTTRAQANAAIENWQALARDGVAFYHGRLNDEEPAVRMFAGKLLGELGSLAKDAIGKLQDVARNDPDDRPRKSCLAALGAIQSAMAPSDPKRLATVQGMVENLRNQKTSVRAQAAEGLGQVIQGDESAAKIAVPALVKALNDYDTYVRLKAVESLGKIGHLAKDAAPSLRRGLRENRDQDVLRAIPSALKKIDE